MSDPTYLIKNGKEFQTFQSSPEKAIQQAMEMNKGHIDLYRLVAIVEKQEIPPRKVSRFD